MFDTQTYNQKMNKTIDVFDKELSSLRTGRANANIRTENANQSIRHHNHT